MGAGQVTVHFATNRAQTNDADLFGSAFREPSEGDTRLYVTGTVKVGYTGSTFQFQPGSMVLDPSHPAQVSGTATVSKIASGEIPSDDRLEHFLRHLPPRSSAAHANAGLFFLPGFANKFIGSMESAARIAVGYGAGTVFCFSWPSLGQFGYSQYVTDQVAALKSGPAIALAFSSLLTLLRKRSAADRPLLHLVTHSMGAHALSSALQTINVATSDLLDRIYFKHAALLAADEDADGLREAKALAPLLTLSEDINVYTNKHDGALFLSGQVNGRGALGMWGPQHLKDLPEKVVWLNCTVVADREETSGFGHGYFDQSTTVMNDVRQVFADNAPAKVEPRVPDPNPIFDARRYTLGTIRDDA